MLQIADKVVMTEIMGSRERAEDYAVRTKDLAAKIPGSVWYDTFDEVVDHVMKTPGRATLSSRWAAAISIKPQKDGRLGSVRRTAKSPVPTAGPGFAVLHTESGARHAACRAPLFV
ncbi:MAG: hypothetical protein ACLRRT_16235 [Ruthenibacterium lactatiformans]